MKTNLWSTKVGLSLFALLVVAAVLFEHVRGVESNDQAERCCTARQWNVGGAGLINTYTEVCAIDVAASDDTPEPIEAAIRRTANAFAAAFDRGDAAAVALLWTVDGEYLDNSGKRFTGRQAIEREYAQFFAEHPNAKIEITIDAIRSIGTDAAIEDGHAALLPRQPGMSPASPYTVVHSKVDGQWLMASVREERGGQSASDDPLAKLDWLVGSWRARQNGGQMDVTFRWVANHGFLERTYSVEQGGRITAAGVQLIGPDPSSRELRSWNFTSDAGYAVGSWIPRPDGWAIASRGKLPDGTTTGAVNYLTRVDENTLSWQSRERKSGGVSLPDTDAVQLTRVVDPR